MSAATLTLVALTLLGTIDDRHVGRLTDERQLLRTSVAIAETGQLAMARDRDFTYLTERGEAVSRFGMGMSLLQVPAALMAGPAERMLGAAASQPLFLIVPFLLVLASAAFAGLASSYLVRDLSPGRTAIVLCALGSPLGSYAATGLSETLQAAALAGAYAIALASSNSEYSRRASWAAFLAGFCAGWAVLAKSSLLIVAPLALLPLLGCTQSGVRSMRLRAAVLGFFPGVATWAFFEIIRFGRPFGSYLGERFDHPFWDGLWRLSVGPNLGLVLFFPAAIVALWFLGSRMADRDWHLTLNLAGGVLPLLALLGLAAPWWAWHGVWGWGPRLLVPGIPMLAACAAAAMAQWRTWLRWGIVALSVAMNLPGVLQHPVPVATYVTTVPWPTVAPEIARRLASYAWRQEPDGSFHISADHVLSEIPQASQLVTFPWFLWANLAQDATRLERPPWRGVRPDLVPAPGGAADLVRVIGGPSRWHFWGQGFRSSEESAKYAAAYDEALEDQVIRLQQSQQAVAALHLAQELVGIAPYGWNDALVLESYRLLKRRDAAAAYLKDLPVQRRLHPSVNVALALFERDAGNEISAKRFLASVVNAFPPDAPLHRALNERLDKWPSGLQDLLSRPIKSVTQ